MQQTSHHGSSENDLTLKAVNDRPSSSLVTQQSSYMALGHPHPTEDTSLPSSLNSEPPADIHPNLLSPLVSCPPPPIFITEHLGVDRRLIVNRKRQLKMYRVWMQGKFRKLST